MLVGTSTSSIPPLAPDAVHVTPILLQLLSTSATFHCDRLEPVCTCMRSVPPDPGALYWTVPIWLSTISTFISSLDESCITSITAVSGLLELTVPPVALTARRALRKNSVALSSFVRIENDPSSLRT